jgi:leucyl aminopeptidase (aminopeptidase T)
MKIKNFGVPAKPLGFTVNMGKITGAVDTNTSDSDFWHYISQSEELLFVAELGAGINPQCEIFSYPHSVQEEKLLGTAHVGLGSNISFGGNRQGRHLDGVMSKASLSVDRLTILSNGQLNSSLLSEKTLDWLSDYNCLFVGRR